MEKIQKIALGIFLTAMTLCASLVLGIIWMQPGVPEVFPKTAASLFIVGLASFLVWLVMVVLEIRNRIEKEGPHTNLSE